MGLTAAADSPLVPAPVMGERPQPPLPGKRHGGDGVQPLLAPPATRPVCDAPPPRRPPPPTLTPAASRKTSACRNHRERGAREESTQSALNLPLGKA